MGGEFLKHDFDGLTSYYVLQKFELFWLLCVGGSVIGNSTGLVIQDLTEGEAGGKRTFGLCLRIVSMFLYLKTLR